MWVYRIREIDALHCRQPEHEVTLHTIAHQTILLHQEIC